MTLITKILKMGGKEQHPQNVYLLNGTTIAQVGLTEYFALNIHALECITMQFDGLKCQDVYFIHKVLMLTRMILPTLGCKTFTLMLSLSFVRGEGYLPYSRA